MPGYSTFRLPLTTLERLNREILNRASIQAITFPSAHVASAFAAALILLKLAPWVGLILLWIAISIAAATVVGGYHFAADVLFAAAIAIVVFGLAGFL
jgi:membrane-associated phospholipid phosphatase